MTTILKQGKRLPTLMDYFQKHEPIFNCKRCGCEFTRLWTFQTTFRGMASRRFIGPERLVTSCPTCDAGCTKWIMLDSDKFRKELDKQDKVV